MARWKLIKFTNMAEEIQNAPPVQSNYFELKTFDNEQMQERGPVGTLPCCTEKSLPKDVNFGKFPFEEGFLHPGK